MQASSNHMEAATNQLDDTAVKNIWCKKYFLRHYKNRLVDWLLLLLLDACMWMYLNKTSIKNGLEKWASFYIKNIVSLTLLL